LVAAERVAKEDAEHDAYKEHVLEKGEFSDPSLGTPLDINSRAEFKDHIARVLESKETLCFKACSTEQNLRQAEILYHGPTNTAVIVPPDSDSPATAFRPLDREGWFAAKLSIAQKLSPEPGLEAQIGGMYALHPEGLEQDLNGVTPTNREPNAEVHMARETSLFEDYVNGAEEAVLGLGAVVSSGVSDLAASYSESHPDSAAFPDQVQDAAYFAQSVEDPEKYPPLNEDMKAQVEERRAYEEIGQKLRQSSGEDIAVSDEQRLEVMQDRMESYMDRQKEHTM
jgi:hypothetical protein